MNYCVVVLCLFFSDSLTWSADSLYCSDTKIRGVDVEKYACYVNKLRQNVGLETWKWRQIVTSHRAHTKYKWPPYDPERTPPMKIFCVRHCLCAVQFAHQAILRQTSLHQTYFITTAHWQKKLTLPLLFVTGKFWQLFFLDDDMTWEAPPTRQYVLHFCVKFVSSNVALCFSVK